MTGLADLNEMLQLATKISASDVHIKAYSVPVFRINGQLVKVDEFGRTDPAKIDNIVANLLDEKEKLEFQKEKEVDLSYSLSGVGRFRINVFRQRGSTGIVFRMIPFNIKSLDELHIPPIVKKISLMSRGLVLVTGATGSGKSTTMASMIKHINENKTCNVITIEDPIEFLIRDKNSVINQREIGTDTKGFKKALRSSLRQDPDVIMIGEMRDIETIQIALTAAETGHLVISTLHTLNASETINRVISVFQPHQQQQIRQQLSSVMAASISQRLLKMRDNRGRIPAIEILLGTEYVKEVILDPQRFKELPEIIRKGRNTHEMQTFDQSIFSILKKRLITEKEALKNATYPEDLKMKIKGVTVTDDSEWSNFTNG